MKKEEKRYGLAVNICTPERNEEDDARDEESFLIHLVWIGSIKRKPKNTPIEKMFQQM